MKIYLARHRGFCSGVKRSIRLAEKTLEDAHGPVYILNDIVHNKSVIEELRTKGLRRVGSPARARGGALLISSHGVSPAIMQQAHEAAKAVVDTTCPLVDRIHAAAKAYIDESREVLLFGDAEHDEVNGIVGIDPEHIHVVKNKSDVGDLSEFDRPVALISQSTSSVHDFERMANLIRARFGDIEVNDTICRPTRLRQAAVNKLCEMAEIVVVIGSKTSANSNRLVEIAAKQGRKSILIDNAGEFDLRLLGGVKAMGITTGASTPEALVIGLIDRIKEFCAIKNEPVEIADV